MASDVDQQGSGRDGDLQAQTPAYIHGYAKTFDHRPSDTCAEAHKCSRDAQTEAAAHRRADAHARTANRHHTPTAASAYAHADTYAYSGPGLGRLRRTG